MTRGARFAVVALIALSAIALWAPDLRRSFGHPLGECGVNVNALNGMILSASPKAAQQGIRVGDAIDMQRSTLSARLSWIYNNSCWSADPGGVFQVAVQHRGGSQVTTVASVPESLADRRVALFRDALAVLLLLMGASLVLLRPNPATWAFFILSLDGTASVNIMTMVGPVWAQLSGTTLAVTYGGCVPYFGVLFALYLLQEKALPPWRQTAVRITYALIALSALFAAVLTPLFVYTGRGFTLFGWGSYIFALPLVATPIVLLATYFESAPAARERIRWVILGFTLGDFALLIAAYMPFLNLSYVTYSILFAFYVISLTSTTAYAVLRHRIVDVNVVVSRAVVYGALSALIVGAFALVDLFFSRALSASNAGLFADIGLALILGFFFNTIHARVDRIVDGILFRARHRAEHHVATVTHAMPHVSTEADVDRLLLEEPARSFDLATAVLARRTDSGDLCGVRYFRCSGKPGTPIADGSTLVAYLKGDGGALRLRDEGWQASAVADDGPEPAVAVPIFSHADLVAIAFFAPHTNGTEIDSDELALIQRLALAAGAAYDRLEAQALRVENERLRTLQAVHGVGP